MNFAASSMSTLEHFAAMVLASQGWQERAIFFRNIGQNAFRKTR